jgi:hypothetical protein
MQHTPEASARAEDVTIFHPKENGPGPAFESFMFRCRGDRQHDRIDHVRTCVHDVEIRDSTVGANGCQRDLIWVGLYGEGQWLKAEEALTLAAALEHAANAQIERVFKEKHRVFLINHPGEGGAA